MFKRLWCWIVGHKRVGFHPKCNISARCYRCGKLLDSREIHRNDNSYTTQ